MGELTIGRDKLDFIIRVFCLLVSGSEILRRAERFNVGDRGERKQQRRESGSGFDVIFDGLLIQLSLSRTGVLRELACCQPAM